MISMSKARTGVTARKGSEQFSSYSDRKSRSVGKDAGAEVAVAAVADDGDDDRVPQLARQAQRHVHGAAGGDAAEDAFLAGEAARHLLRLGLAHVLGAVDAAALEDLRQVGFRPLADARDLRALFRLAAHDLDRRVLLLEKARAAHDGPGRAHAGDEVRDLPFGVAPDLRPRG